VLGGEVGGLVLGLRGRRPVTAAGRSVDTAQFSRNIWCPSAMDSAEYPVGEA
jgi:hypothetical protein